MLNKTSFIKATGIALFGLCLAVAVLAISPVSVFAAPPKADLDQVRNGNASSPIDPPNWVNGNAGDSNAHYYESHSIPYRIILENLNTTIPHTLVIEWDIKHSGGHAIDYITHYQRLEPHAGFGNPS